MQTSHILILVLKIKKYTKVLINVYSYSAQRITTDHVFVQFSYMERILRFFFEVDRSFEKQSNPMYFRQTRVEEKYSYILQKKIGSAYSTQNSQIAYFSELPFVCSLVYLQCNQKCTSTYSAVIWTRCGNFRVNGDRLRGNFDSIFFNNRIFANVTATFGALFAFSNAFLMTYQVAFKTPGCLS